VLKADGLAAGKGVILCASEAEAREAIDVFFTERRFGETTVVLEEFLKGEELSLLALCDGENVVPLAPAQDYKRIFDGDQGPNTGGMGNARFGDPETQAVLPRLRTDLPDLFLAAREPGGLAGASAEFFSEWAVTLVLASAGYPESSSRAT
jgi:phosphoribosylamine---glycine ligase